MDQNENTLLAKPGFSASCETWHDDKQLSDLRQQAQACQVKITTTFCQASIGSIAPKQAHENYRNRVKEALLEPTDNPPSLKPRINLNQASQIKTHQFHLKPPSPVVLYEDPLKSFLVHGSNLNLTSEEADQNQEQMQQSRNTAILMEEMRSELLKPLIGIIACILLIAFIGASVYFNEIL